MVYSHDGPIGRGTRGYILTIDQSYAGSDELRHRRAASCRSQTCGGVCTRARRGHCRIDHEDLIEPSRHSREDSILPPVLHGHYICPCPALVCPHRGGNGFVLRFARLALPPPPLRLRPLAHPLCDWHPLRVYACSPPAIGPPSGYMLTSLLRPLFWTGLRGHALRVGSRLCRSVRVRGRTCRLRGGLCPLRPLRLQRRSGAAT